MIPHGGIPYESLTGISGKIQNTDLIPDPLSGVIETVVTRRFSAAVPLPENTAVYINTSNFAGLAKSNASGTMPCVGVAKSCASGVQATVVVRGLKEGIVTSAPQNTPFYVSEVSAGLIQTSIPATGFIQRLGHATFLSGQAMINPDPFYYNLSGFPVGVVI